MDWIQARLFTLGVIFIVHILGNALIDYYIRKEVLEAILEQDNTLVLLVGGFLIFAAGFLSLNLYHILI